MTAAGRWTGASGERFRDLAGTVEGTRVAALICDPDLRIVYVNRAFETMTGLSYDDLVSTSLRDAVDLADAPTLDLPAAGRGELTFFGKGEGRRKGGPSIPVDVALLPIRHESLQAPLLLVLLHDVGERERGELVVRDRMAALGQLAAGLVHEINNPLAVIVSDLAAAREALARLRQEVAARSSPALADIDDRIRAVELLTGQAAREAWRIRDVVHGVGTFARERDPAGPVDVLSILDDAIDLADNEIRHRARLVKEYGVVAEVWASRERLRQVFLNVLLNAVQALPVGAAASHEIKVSVRSGPDRRVVIEIADTGAGIAAGDLDRIFEPFFTTKPAGGGRGLGLAVAQGLVREIGGSIRVASELGRGSAVSIALPRCADRSEAASERLSRRAKILVADDDAYVARALGRMLSPHEVVLCHSGQEAVEKLGATEFDIVFCDVMMPDLSGPDVYERARSDRPGLEQRFVFVTAGAFTPEARAFVERIPNRTAQKPFEQAEITRIVRDMLRLD